jgi:hypothetical protein
LGVDVLFPATEDTPFDLVAYPDGAFTMYSGTAAG